MSWERLYRNLQPETSGTLARAFRTAHHTMVALGIAVMLADTVKRWRQAHHQALDIGFHIACAFFFAEYLLRIVAAPGAPAAYRRGWRARLSWAVSAGGVFDLLGALPGVLDVAFSPNYASLYGFIWVFKPVRYEPGLVSLQRVISRASHALLSVLLGFGIVLFGRRQPRLFARARRTARAVRLDPARSVVGDRHPDNDRLRRCNADHPTRADSGRGRHGFRHPGFRALGRHSRDRLCRGAAAARVSAHLGPRRQGAVLQQRRRLGHRRRRTPAAAARLPGAGGHHAAWRARRLHVLYRLGRGRSPAETGDGSPRGRRVRR